MALATLDAPVEAILRDVYSTLYHDLFAGGKPSQPTKEASGWVFFALVLPYAVLAWVIIQQLCLIVGTRVGLAVGYPKKRSHNIGDSFREFVGMSTQSSLALLLLWHEPWFWDISKWNYAVVEGPTFASVEGTNVPVDGGIRKSFVGYYPAEFGWYMGLLVCMFVEYPRKSDFHVMALHHVVTMFLIAYSAVIGHARIGVLVMFLHDFSDTFLHASKIFHYALEGSPWHILCDITFAVFALTFFVTRLVLYPFLIWQTYETLSQFDWSFAEKSLTSALALLVFFHMYWFALIMKILKQAIIGGEVQGDVRDDDEIDSKRRRAIGLTKDSDKKEN